MSKLSKSAVDAALRAEIFDEIITNGAYSKINDRQYGTIRTDENGVDRYCRIGVIVAEEREDMTASELMDAEIAAYEEAQKKKAEKKAAALAKKAARTKPKDDDEDEEGSEE